jgi:transposase
VPGDKEMKRRKILASYRREQQNRNRAINRLHGLFVSQGITTMKRKDLAAGAAREAAIQELTGLERSEAEHLQKCLVLHEERIKELENLMEEESAGDELIERLQEVPGVGPKVSFAFAAHVAADRFENAGQVSNYLGLVPRVYISGDTVRYGKITKRGNGYLRALLVQASWSIAWSKNGGKLKERYDYMTGVKGISKKKAVVAIARRLAELLYTLMRDGTSYEYRPFMGGKGEGNKLAQLAKCA